MKSGMSVVRDQVSKTLSALSALKRQDVLVGVPSTRTERKEKGEPVTNAEIGYWMEFGAPAANIPARPHLIPGVKRAQADIDTQFKAAALSAMKGDVADVNKRLNAAGLLASSSVKNLITDGLSPALSPYTIAARQARRKSGKAGTKPLIDTGNYRNSITYVVRKK